MIALSGTFKASKSCTSNKELERVPWANANGNPPQPSLCRSIRQCGRRITRQLHRCSHRGTTDNRATRPIGSGERYAISIACPASVHTSGRNDTQLAPARKADAMRRGGCILMILSMLGLSPVEVTRACSLWRLQDFDKRVILAVQVRKSHSTIDHGEQSALSRTAVPDRAG